MKKLICILLMGLLLVFMAAAIATSVAVTLYNKIESLGRFHPLL